MLTVCRFIVSALAKRDGFLSVGPFALAFGNVTLSAASTHRNFHAL